ncbi:MAG: hypothetical protein ACM31D_10395 [Bacteroidota bacterium]
MIDVLGTQDGVTVDDWYRSDANHIAYVDTAAGDRLAAADVENLVVAMAQFSAPPAGQTSLTAHMHAQLDGVIAANWHSR